MDNKDQNILTTKGISKSFNDVFVLNDVDFDLRAGEIHAVVGENGAGKSTFIKIISGVYKPTIGQIEMNGAAVDFPTVAASEAAGIRTVMQEINLVEYFTIFENIFIGSEMKTNPGFMNWMDDKKMRQRASEVMHELGLDVDVRRTVAGLNVSMKKVVEICKVLVHNPKIVIFDEPTTSLGEEARKRLLSIISDLKKKDLSIIYISHNMEEVMSIADRITVFRDGNKVETVENKDISVNDIIRLMLGNKTYSNYKRVNTYIQDEVVLELENVNTDKLNDISLQVKKGEVVGIAGMVGAGKTEVAKAIFGLDKIHKGTVKFGTKHKRYNPISAIAEGMAFVPEERQAEGLIPDFSVSNNVSLTYLNKWSKLGLINKKAEKATAEEFIEKLSIKTQGPPQLIKYLSGGNQQKVILSRWLTGDFKLGIFDEPTKGIDIKAKEDIYTLIEDLAKQGKSILIMSSYLPELLVTCDRILVLRNGHKVGEFINSESMEEDIVAAMLGGNTAYENE